LTILKFPIISQLPAGQAIPEVQLKSTCHVMKTAYP